MWQEESGLALLAEMVNTPTGGRDWDACLIDVLGGAAQGLPMKANSWQSLQPACRM